MEKKIYGNIKSKPFVKWAGGKSQLLDEIDKRLPFAVGEGGNIDYVEPLELTFTKYIKYIKARTSKCAEAGTSRYNAAKVATFS